MWEVKLRFTFQVATVTLGSCVGNLFPLLLWCTGMQMKQTCCISKRTGRRCGQLNVGQEGTNTLTQIIDLALEKTSKPLFIDAF